jgi:hypothetical protein
MYIVQSVVRPRDLNQASQNVKEEVHFGVVNGFRGGANLYIYIYIYIISMLIKLYLIIFKYLIKEQYLVYV